MLASAGRRIQLAAFSPESLSPQVVTAIAFAPSVLAGLLIFRLHALYMLTLAAAVGGLVHLVARVLGRTVNDSPVLPAVVGSMLVGAGAPILWVGAVALAAALLELGRTQLLPAARLQVGVLAYAGIFVAAPQGVANYLLPSGAAAPEPIRTALALPGGVAIDPVRLYVGNVPGPVFATSLLAVAVGVLWLWYARRLSLLVIFTFGVGAIVPIAVMGWNPAMQLESGPLWLLAALVLADRQTLPLSSAGRPLLGLAAGTTALALRARGYAIEATALSVGGLQLAVGLVAGGHWVLINRRRLWEGLRRLSAPGFALRRLNAPLRAG